MRQILLGFGMIAVLAGCGDPLRDVARLNDVTVSRSVANLAQTPSETRDANGGLFSRLLDRDANDPANGAIEAALVTTAAPPTAAPGRGLFGLFSGGGRNAPRDGPDLSDVSAGSVMPFGQIARVCGLSNSQLGTRVDAEAGYNIYDTIPNSTAPRPFYVTGFADDCARTFTGAVVVTGDVETHEFVRYQPSNSGIDYSTTDNAYEALKASECRVGRGVPCDEGRRARLDRNTQFITVYNFFGGTFSAVPTRWAQILVHDGEVLAMSIKDGS